MIEIALLATTVVSKFLVPFFKKGKDGFTKELADTEGEAAAHGLTKTAAAIWQRITGRFDKDNEKKAVSLFQEDPENMDKMMTTLLQQRLESDPDFRKQIDQLVEAPVAGTGQTSWQLMAEYAGVVDARNSTIRDNATVAAIIVNPAKPAGSAQQEPRADGS